MAYHTDTHKKMCFVNKFNHSELAEDLRLRIIGTIRTCRVSISEFCILSCDKRSMLGPQLQGRMRFNPSMDRASRIESAIKELNKNY